MIQVNKKQFPFDGDLDNYFQKILDLLLRNDVRLYVPVDLDKGHIAYVRSWGHVLFFQRKLDDEPLWIRCTCRLQEYAENEFGISARKLLTKIFEAT